MKYGATSQQSEANLMHYRHRWRIISVCPEGGWRSQKPKRMPDFAALLLHIRDLRSEVTRINARLDTLKRSTASPSGDGTAAGGLLHEAIADCYNLPELRQLAHSLGLNHDDLNGDGLTDAALALVLWAGRHGKMGALLAALANQRPHVDWSGFR